MLLPRLDLAVALGVGTAGALVDVSSYARLTDGLSRRWGRDDAFYGVEPGTFSFVLDNADGRFTPENASSPLATTLTEGMSACVSVGGRLTAGVVRSIEPEFPSGEAAWSRVRMTCEDSLGELARVSFERGMVAAAAFEVADASWPMDDVAGSTFAEESRGSLRVMRARTLTFGIDSAFSGGSNQAQVSVPASATDRLIAVDPTVIVDDSLSGKWWNLSFTPMTQTGYLQFVDGNGDLLFGVRNGAFAYNGVELSAFTVGRPYFVSFIGGTARELYVDGVRIYSDPIGFPPLTAGTPRWDIGSSTSGDSTYRFSAMSASSARIAGESASGGTTGGRLALIANACPTVGFSTPGSGLSGAMLDPAQGFDSALDALNELATTEQGYLYVATTGTLTSPTNQVTLRERVRPQTVSYSFDVENELQGAPAFLRDVTNLVSRVVVSGQSGRLTVSDSALVARAGQSSATETVSFARDNDRRAWGQDRLIRGANTKMQIASVVVDAMTTPTDRSADLLALIPGDRVQFTNLPSTQLGFSTWDGWFLGATETHTISEHTFALHFQPVLPPVAVYDTNTYMASGELTLNGAINSAVTSISVESTGALLSTTNTPYVMQIDDEQMTVTTVVGASSPQTVTVTRGANGTTAASHLDNAVLVGPVPESIYAF